MAFFATVAVRAAISFFEISSTPEWVFWSFQAVAVTIIVVVSFYYSDLYAIDQTLSIRELLLRLMSGVGIACILIAIVSYPIPRFGKTLYASQMALMVLSLCAWRVGFMRVIERARIHARVLVVGLQALARWWRKSSLSKRNWAWKWWALWANLRGNSHFLTGIRFEYRCRSTSPRR